MINTQRDISEGMTSHSQRLDIIMNRNYRNEKPLELKIAVDK